MKRFACPISAAATLPAWSASASEFDCLFESRQQVYIPSPVEAVIESVQLQIPAGVRYSVRFD